MKENEMLEIIKTHKSQYKKLLQEITKPNGDIKKGQAQNSVRLQIKIDTLERIINDIKYHYKIKNL